MVGYKSPTHQGWKDAKAKRNHNPYPTRPRQSVAYLEYERGQQYFYAGLNYLGEEMNTKKEQTHGR